MTEIEYIKCLQVQDNSVNAMNDSSFFKSFLNVEKSGGTTKEEERIRSEENHALRDINEQMMKKVENLTKQVEELEHENTHLSNEHLVMLKKQENMFKKGGSESIGDQSTLDDT